MWMSLYIPFWLYSNFIVTYKRRRTSCFTFHSGYILINCYKLQNFSKYSFTFHSGYILIFFVPLLLPFLFFFTFHSGYILILMGTLTGGGALIFTFHSGYILINMSKYKCQGFVALHSILVIF